MIGRRLFYWRGMEQPAAVLRKRNGKQKRLPGDRDVAVFGGAGWSSPVARQAHNLKVVGSNPTPATKQKTPPSAGFFVWM
jgi:hypothetical protein